MTIGIISDTHGVVLPEVHNALRDVDQIIHAGDIDSPEVLIELGAIAPVTAVIGNMDSPELFPHLSKQTTISLGNSSAVIIHDRQKLRDLPSNVAVVICGHTHTQLWGRLADYIGFPLAGAGNSAFILNPGCGGDRSSTPSIAILTVSADTLDANFVAL